jgi:hypothetical protein
LSSQEYTHKRKPSKFAALRVSGKKKGLIIFMKNLTRTGANVKTKLLDAALRMATIGPIVLLSGVKAGKCSCGNPECNSPGKHPITRNGCKDASQDPETIAKWFTKHPDANVGLATGLGIVVIDIDGPEGEAVLNSEQKKLGQLPETMEVTTGKGRHLYYRKPLDTVISNSKPKHWKKIDIRGDGGYVVTPPSLHVSGRRYEFVNESNPVPLPDNWINYLSNLHGKGTIEPSKGTGKVTEGGRNDFLSKKAYALKKHGLQGKALTEAVEALNQCQCDPPLPEVEVQKICNGKSGIQPNPAETKGNLSKFQKINICIKNAGWEFFLDQNDEPYISTKIYGHYENIHVVSAQFRGLLRAEMSHNFDEGVSKDSIDQAVGAIIGDMIHYPERRTLYQRVTRVENSIIIDSGRDDWSVYRITADGWHLTQMEENPFIRESKFRPYSCDENTSRTNWDQVFGVLGIKDPQAQGLLKIWLCTALIPSIPRPGLVINGPSGGGKTTLTSFLRQIVDPCEVPIERFPNRDTRSLELKLYKNHIPAFDNLTYIDQESSDILCQVITGSLFDQRKLYTDSETVSRFMKKPWILCGVSLPGTASDFLSRTFMVELETISQPERRDESAVKKELEAIIPGLQALILDGISAGLKTLPYIRTSGFERLADSHRWSLAMWEILEMSHPAIDSIWAINKSAQDSEAAGGDVLTELIPEFLRLNGGEWEGQTSELHDEMFKHFNPDRQAYRTQWPKKANNLSRRLNMLHETLIARGVKIEKRKLHSSKIIKLILLNSEFNEDSELDNKKFIDLDKKLKLQQKVDESDKVDIFREVSLLDHRVAVSY